MLNQSNLFVSLCLTIKKSLGAAITELLLFYLQQLERLTKKQETAKEIMIIKVQCVKDIK